jgi:hypothetical protein
MMSKALICTTCGTQYPPDQQVPELCTICNDDRQYIGDNGQKWTSMEVLKNNYSTRISKLNDQIAALKMQPDFSLANRALLVQSPEGNILWDCMPLPDQQTVDYINSIGGLKAIAFSHPHYYSTMNEWAALFNCPIYIHELDSEWIMYPTPSVKLWNGDSLPLWDGIKIVHTSGHFPGSCVLWMPSLTGEGTLLCGDSVYLSRSKRHLSVMYSYPNLILLSKRDFATFDHKTSALKFDTLYGAFDNQDLEGNAMDVFNTSMQRYRDSYEIN